jgi:hypothetical protein
VTKAKKVVKKKATVKKKSVVKKKSTTIKSSLPKGWHVGKPKKPGIYKTSRTCLIKGDRVIGNGYAEWKDGRWISVRSRDGSFWGDHSDINDFIWFGPVKDPN